MADETELEIKILPDEDVNAEAAQAADEKAAAKAGEQKIAAKVDDPAVQELMSQYKDLEAREQAANQRASQAEQEAAQARDEAQRATKQASTSQLDTVSTALAAAKSDADSAKKDIKAAKEAGDIDAEVEAQDRLAQARADERRLDEAKYDLEQRAKVPPKQQPKTPSDPVEAYISNRTEPTAKWLRAHSDYIRDPRKQAKLSAAHYDAEGEGLVADTAEYFKHVEKFLGITKDETDTTKAANEAPQRKPPPVAPGSTNVNGGNGGSPVVTLSRGEAAAAQDGTLVWNYDDPKGKFKKGEPIGIQEFARRKLSQQKQGLHDRNSYEA